MTVIEKQGVVEAADGTRQPEADSGHDYPMPAPHAKTAEQFYAGVIGPATLSAKASRLAVDKASDPKIKQFANFELREAVAVTAIIEGLNTSVPPMDYSGRDLLEKLQTAEGTDFDKTYIAAELANHEFLRDLTESYLSNANGHADMAERHGRDLASLALTAFKEHVVLSKGIVQALETA